MNRWPLRRRLVMAAAVATTLSVGVLILVSTFVLTSALNSGVEQALQARADGAAASVKIQDGRVTVGEPDFDTALDGNVWVFAGNRAVETAPGPPEVQVAARRLAKMEAPATVDLDGPGVAMMSVPLMDKGARIGTVVVSVSLAPFESSRSIAIRWLIGVGLVVIVGVILLADILVRRALRPVANMAHQAKDWGATDLNRRFDVGPVRDELSDLGATLDELLGRIAASLRHERRFSAEMAHELRTPLAVMRSDLDIALRRTRTADELRETLLSVRDEAIRLSGVVATLMSLAEDANEHRGEGDVVAAVDAAVRAARTTTATIEISLASAPHHESLIVGAEVGVLTQVLAPVIDNAVRHAQHRVTVAIRTNRSAFVSVAIEDDGPGIDPSDSETIFEPGRQLNRSAGGGAGLGLSLARRIAQSVGGDVRAGTTASELGGARFSVTFPLLSDPATR